MGKPGAALGHWTILLGIAIGLAGLVLAALAYPLYNRILKKERERFAPGDPAAFRRIIEMR